MFSLPLLNKHIVIVDDQKDAVQGLIDALQAVNAKVTYLNNGNDALRLIPVLYPDLLLIDVYMPAMGGFALSRLLRENSYLNSVPLLFVTSANDLQHRLEGFQIGAVDYISKPFDLPEVLARISVHLRLQPKEIDSRVLAGVHVTQDSEQLILQAALKIIGTNLADPPKLKDLAELVGTYDKKLSMLFRKHLGTSVFAWIREERLLKAQELLADSEVTIEQIAELVGFQTAGNFATAFKARFMLTPSEFRRKKPNKTPALR